MSQNCKITNVVTNTTPYSFTLLNDGLDSGYWVVSPQPIPANNPGLIAFEGIGVEGTATGSVGYAIYNVIDSAGAMIGTLQFNFSDPYSGHNTCSSYTAVPSLSISNDCPSSGSTFTVNWAITAD